MIIPPQSLVAGNPAVSKPRISGVEKEYFVEWDENYREYSRGYFFEPVVEELYTF